MKKLLYALMIAFSVSVTFSSCTEEQVEPSNSTVIAGGGTSENGN